MTVEGRIYGGLSAEQRSQDRRARLLEAARGLIADGGVAPLTVDVVCQRAGLSKRYFYHEFATKEDLLDACAEDLFSRLWATMEEVLTTMPRADRVEGTLRAVMHTLACDPADARLYMECPGFPRLRERQQRAVREFSEHMAAHAIAFTRRPRRSVDRVLAVRALVAGTTDLIIGWLHGDIDTDENRLIATMAATARGAAATL
ncbi:TetR/AcrR family transcriptional regulator [Mycobacterium simiae]|uniref:TetR/AcrR family transcriptional regulator n=1 Tax=Mycobacterium simiae TaxID=1784 RepID=A0A5B1BLF0_MYCSI|nr:TetR/AcrR family transcriptional regulator [Mycobacterium simiae]KAA1248320.1 TetR/AcrR family transcriptional regulator [Mycobacterium simiae]